MGVVVSVASNVDCGCVNCVHGFESKFCSFSSNIATKEGGLPFWDVSTWIADIYHGMMRTPMHIWHDENPQHIHRLEIMFKRGLEL